MRKLFFILSMVMLSSPLWGESKLDRIGMRHELRVGWGDQIFESLMWHKPQYYTIVPELSVDYEGLVTPVDYRQTYSENYKYSQHWWLEYQYRFNYWFSMGALLDASGVSWERVTRDGYGNEVDKENKRHNFVNVVLMPTMRFTYLHHENVNLYSSLGLGMDINTGTEKDIYGNNTAAGMAMQVSLLGLSANYKRCFWTIEYGGMLALRDKNTVFLAKSRMLALSMGVRFDGIKK